MLNVYAKFVWINKNIRDGGSILSMSKGDQLNHSSSCNVFVGSQSRLCVQHILQRSILSSFECYQIIWLSVSRPSLPHLQLPCCAIWRMPLAHLQSHCNPTIDKGSPWLATLLARHQSNVWHRCELPLTTRQSVCVFFQLATHGS